MENIEKVTNEEEVLFEGNFIHDFIDEDLEKAVIPLIPMAQLIQPEDIAQTILFLASRQARLLTGQVIKVSGGHALSPIKIPPQKFCGGKTI